MVKRSSRKKGGFSLPVALAALVLVALFATGSLVIYAAHSEELGDIQSNPVSHVGRAAPRDLRPVTGDSSRALAADQKAEAPKDMKLPDEHPAAAAAAVENVQAQPAAVAASATAAGEAVPKTATVANRMEWKMHHHKSCQNYADNDATERLLSDAKLACNLKESCVAIECPTGQQRGCTLRAMANFVDYDITDCYEQIEIGPDGKVVSSGVHPFYNQLLKEYPFQQVASQTGNQVNIILVRSQMNQNQIDLYKKYKDDILFLGISSMNDYPLHEAVDYVGMFPGFLHMMHDPEKQFPPHVKTLLMSQSDFNLPNFPERDYSVPRKYDFTYSGSDCDIDSDGAGWCGWSKNWSFVRKMLPMMCEEFKLKGVLVATRDKADKKGYTIPESCKGLMHQTTYLKSQSDYFDFLSQSRFAFLPQVHDASPRVAGQALAMDTPILMNYHIQGGWKYVSNLTGEFFHDENDFRESLKRILKNTEIKKRYEPRRWMHEHYGNEHSGKRLFDFVMDNFGYRVKLPKGTKLLLP